MLPAFALWAAAAGAPAQATPGEVKGFVSIEAFELRKEFVMRFDTIQDRVGAEAVSMVDATNRAGLEKAIGEWLIGKCPVEVDGRVIEMDLDRVHFVRPDPEKGLVVEDREQVPASDALVGVVFAAALEGPPEVVRVVWEVFPADGSEAEVEVGVRTQRAARKLTPQNPELVWKNESGLAVPEWLSLPPVPEQSNGPLWLVAAAWLILALGLARGFRLMKTGRKARAAAECAMAILAAAAMGWVGKRTAPVVVTAAQADEISYAILRNIYHAFDYRRESDIYDTLAKSATGDLLTRIYLEIQRSLQVETQGGARVRVTDVDLRRCELTAPRGDAFVADCEWVAVGTVTHWGHTHDRVNRYRAKLSVAPVEGEWRLVGLELVSEERI